MVDDMLIICDMVYINELKEALKTEFEMKDLRATKRILGIDIVRDKKKGVLLLNQTRYIQKVLKDFGMLSVKSVSTPINLQRV